MRFLGPILPYIQRLPGHESFGITGIYPASANLPVSHYQHSQPAGLLGFKGEIV